MCGFGKCKICGDISYECNITGACGCANDLKGLIYNIDADKRNEAIEKVKRSKRWKFVKKHGFP